MPKPPCVPVSLRFVPNFISQYLTSIRFCFLCINHFRRIHLYLGLNTIGIFKFIILPLYPQKSSGACCLYLLKVGRDCNSSQPLPISPFSTYVFLTLSLYQTQACPFRPQFTIHWRKTFVINRSYDSTIFLCCRFCLILYCATLPSLLLTSIKNNLEFFSLSLSQYGSVPLSFALPIRF